MRLEIIGMAYNIFVLGVVKHNSRFVVGRLHGVNTFKRQ